VGKTWEASSDASLAEQLFDAAKLCAREGELHIRSYPYPDPHP